MLTVYGIPNSQPVRAVLWPCLLKGLPFELRLTSQNRDAKRPEYLSEVNPRGTVPAIEDGEVVLWESHAIMVYLAEKHGWTDLYPTDHAARARVNQYLHFHHRNTRELVVHWSRALWPSVFGVTEPDDQWLAQNTFTGSKDNETTVSRTLAILNGMLAKSPFLAGDSLTLADISAYEELGQNQPRYANCTDYDGYPAIGEWLVRMSEQPYHDAVHEVWSLIGDVHRVEGGMKTIARANKKAADTIRRAVQSLRPMHD